jgi:hypothetical protein
MWHLIYNVYISSVFFFFGFQSDVGMIEFVGLIKVNIVKGTDLAVRDVMSSDPYVMINLGHQVSTFLWVAMVA